MSSVPSATPTAPSAPTAVARNVSEAERQQNLSIIGSCHLSKEAVATVQRLQRVRAMSFGAAAIRLGYATQADIDRAVQPPQPPQPITRNRQAAPVQRLVLAHAPFHPRSESIRTLRTELLLRHEATDTANILAVLSPCVAEGRSQLAAELAIAFAQLGRPTLLVDADLRHPTQHLLFNADNSCGLSMALSHDQQPVLQPVANLPALFLLTAGPLPPNPLELLSDRRFEGLVRDWQQNFQFVVLDTPPVGKYADGLAVATIVGRVLSLSRAQHTPYKDTRDMMRRLAATRSRVLGAVINHF